MKKVKIEFEFECSNKYYEEQISVFEKSVKDGEFQREMQDRIYKNEEAIKDVGVEISIKDSK